jgi:hypothetical protein
MCICSAASAQTDPAALLVPFPPGVNGQVQGNALFENQGYIKKSDDDFRISIYESEGRYQLTDKFRINPTVGYDARVIDINTKSNVVPGTLTDTGVSFGTPLYQFNSGWFVAGIVGVGYAGSNAFVKSDAYYGRATAIVGKELGPDSSLLIGLDYNGNRSAYPDIPLPGFAYSKRYFPTIVAVVGFPYSSVTWKPVPEFKAEAGFSFPNEFDVHLEYGITQHIKAVASYEAYEEPFHVDQVGGNDRMFYCYNGVEAGLKFQPMHDVGLFAAAGYQFGQEFNRGWDDTDMDRIVSISDEPYLRFGLNLSF